MVFFKNMGAGMKRFFRALLRRGDGHIAISSFASELIAKVINIKNIETIPVCHVFPKETPIVKPPDKKPIELLFVGRLVSRKGVRYLIDAMPIILEKFEVTLNIVGGGLLIDDLREQVESLGLNDVVNITGRVSYSELESYYERSHVFILPAIYDEKGDTEGLGIVLLEALSHGLPLVASGVGGIVDIVKDNVTGLLTEEKNSKSIAEAVIEILSDKELYLRLASDGYKFVADRFSRESVVKQVASVYEAVLKRKANR
jgi:glycosyltransferase involved in cell wall biosynthesis